MCESYAFLRGHEGRPGAAPDMGVCEWMSSAVLYSRSVSCLCVVFVCPPYHFAVIEIAVLVCVCVRPDVRAVLSR